MQHHITFHPLKDCHWSLYWA